MKRKPTTGSNGIDPIWYGIDDDVQRYVGELVPVVDSAKFEAWNLFVEKIHKGEVRADNFGELIEEVVDYVICRNDLGSYVEDENIELHNDIFQHVLSLYAAKP